MLSMAEKRKHDDEEKSGEAVISLQDIIEEDVKLESTANAVLSGSNDQDCTYADGYVVRQALYACITCETSAYAGICLACSLECHDGHELFELYTKRHFRCDCGNSKFSNLTCCFHANKDPINDRNKYNHNFKGTYCTCKRPYPDPEDDTEDEMVQCSICEDWFHSRHLEGKGLPKQFAEMICHLCMKDTGFLWYYNWKYTPYHTTETDVDVCNIEDGVKSTVGEKDCKDDTVGSLKHIEKTALHSHREKSENSGVCSIQQSCSSKYKQNIAEDLNNTKKSQNVTKLAAATSCRLERLKKIYDTRKFPESAAFWPDGWRDNLCRCTECKLIMSELNYLYSNEDTVAEYEKRGAGRYPDSSMSSGMKALGEMNRVQQIEVIQGYNDMKSKLSEFLSTFAQEGKVVTKEDIGVFFQRMSEGKRVKVDIPHSCK